MTEGAYIFSVKRTLHRTDGFDPAVDVAPAVFLTFDEMRKWAYAWGAKMEKVHEGNSRISIELIHHLDLIASNLTLSSEQYNHFIETTLPYIKVVFHTNDGQLRKTEEISYRSWHRLPLNPIYGDEK